MRIKDIPAPEARRFAKAIDTDKDGALSEAELDAAAARPDPVKTRLLEKAFGDGYDPATIRSGADLAALLRQAPATATDALAGPSPRYDRLFEGPRSEWVVAFGGDTHHAASERAPPDVAQYRGFKTFLERLGFRRASAQAGVDNSGFAVFKKTLAAPDGHAHELTVKVISGSQLENAADEFQRTSAERRGYFSLSHAGEGLGMNVGGSYVRPENVLDSPAPALVVAAVACKSYEHFAAKVAKYMEQHGIPAEKVSFFGTSQEIEMTQADGAMAVLKQIFAGALQAHGAPSMLRAADDAYNPIMASYDPSSYERDRSRMEMDTDIRATPVLKAWIGGAAVELPKRTR